MDLTKILAVSGKPGLFKMLSQTKNSFIVESLLDGKRFPVFSHERVSSLEEISIFSTGDEDIPLREIFRKVSDHLQGKSAPDPKSGEAGLRAFFVAAVPEFDEERVYTSDIKKVIAWYNLLLEEEMLDFEEEKSETGPDESSAEPGKQEAKDE